MKIAAIFLFSFFVRRFLYAQADHPGDSIFTSNRKITDLDKKVDAEVREYMTRIGVVGMSVGISRFAESHGE